MSEDAAPTTASETVESEYGQNAWVIEEMRQQFLANPASVDETWRAFFAPSNGSKGMNGNGSHATNGTAVVSAPAALPKPTVEIVQTRANADTLPARPVAPAPVLSEGEEIVALRGAAGRIVENMVTSLAVPTATSVHPLPAKLLEVNRRLINEHQETVGGGKISFTHLIAYAVVKALHEVPSLNSSFVADTDGKGTPGVIHHEHVNLGIAIDLERSDGSRSLVVPAVRAADTLDFVGFVASYEDLVGRARGGKLAVEDFTGVTVTITNPGTLGTTQSVPRLMAGQGAIIGVGALDYPVEFAATPPQTLASLGIGKVLTLTSTYDHRIIQGAESGLFLKRVHELLVGERGFYDEIFAVLGVAEPPARWQRAGAAIEQQSNSADRLAVHTLVEAYRLHGHLAAWIDPLQDRAPTMPTELDPERYGFSVWDLDKGYPASELLGKEQASLSELLAFLRRSYCSTIGVEYLHIQNDEQRRFIATMMEREAVALGADEQRYLLDRLNAAEAFEQFLHARYPALRRFSLEGGESTIPFLDAALEAAIANGIEEAVIGMAHRGRLNVLANTLGKPFADIFAEFEDTLDPLTVEGNGDVKYHKGGRGKWVGRDGRTLPVTMPPNPSHLETVNPVVLGMTRAKQERVDLAEHSVLSVLIHGDASFAGQGVVAETLNLSQLEGYGVGGTLHLIINNQVGFTTNPVDGRSTRYSSDVAKAIEAPVFHVNGDDPEAVVRVARLAEAYRAEFGRDVVVDLVCYRRLGHNEGDDPSYTQPLMYKRIEQLTTTRNLYAAKLEQAGVLSAEEIAADKDAFQSRMLVALEQARAVPHPHFDHLPELPLPVVPPLSSSDGVDRTALDALAHRLFSWPSSFTIHPKLDRQFQQRAEMFRSGEVDWALGEALAYGTLLLEGTDVRLTGQDARRGTFSHRHAVLIDYETGGTYTALSSLGEAIDANEPLGDGRALGRFAVRDSLLSEYAALGFEYGYAVERPDALVLWEAQFGDFANGAQIMIDNVIVAAEEKWGQLGGLVMLLPHGYEGQGPEHSSARLERYLQLSANGNISVVQPTTAAQFFHLLRTHVHQTQRRPLIVMSPKSILRARGSRSSVDELVSGAFAEVLEDPDAGVVFDRNAVGRVVLCSGKIGFELQDRNRKRLAGNAGEGPVAVVRVEQLHPWPSEAIERVLAAYPQATEIVWAQDEPANMGPWTYVSSRLAEVLGDATAVRLVSRRAAASPATGSHILHDLEMQMLADEAVGPQSAA